MIGDLFIALRYYLVFQCAALCALPLCFLIFRRLSDRGWALAKIAGPLLICTIGWWGAHGLWKFNTFLLWNIIFALLALNILFLYVKWDDFTLFLSSRRRTILWIEALFLVGFLVAIGVRATVPEATFDIERYGAEKHFDYTFFHNLYRTESFPPQDTWLAGFSINYYYYGHFLFASLSRIAGVPPEIGYNLSLAGLCGLICIMAFSVAHQLTRSNRWSCFAAWLVMFGGNLDAIRQVMQILRDSGPSRLFSIFNFWDSSRVIRISDFAEDGLITEFPAFSLLLGDLHAHFMALPIVLGTLLVLIAIARTLRQHRKAAPDLFIAPKFQWLALAFFLGVLSAANLWDYFSLASIAIILVSLLLIPNKSKGWMGLLVGLTACMLMIILAWYILFVQFQIEFHAPFQAGWRMTGALPPRFDVNLPIKIIPDDHRTMLAPFLIHWGIFLLPIFLWAFPKALWRLLNCEWPKFAFYTLLALLVCTTSYNIGHTLTTAAIAFLLVCVVGCERFSGQLTNAIIIRALLIASLLLLWGIEIFYVDDAFERLNTLFKTTYPLWAILAICAVWCWRQLLRLSSDLWARAFCINLIVLSLSLSALYPIMGYGSRYLEKEYYPGRSGTLNALSHLEENSEWSDDYQLAKWIKLNLPREIQIIETCGETYAPDGRIAAWSGNPSFLGWLQHESVWRGHPYDKYAEQLSGFINSFYSTGNELYLKEAIKIQRQAAHAPHDEYGDVYVVVFGELEMQRYGPAARDVLDEKYPRKNLPDINARLYIIEYEPLQ